MGSWFERWRQRQSDLDQGVDADLVRDNRRRYRLAFGLIGSGLLLGFLDAKIHFPSSLRLIVVGVAITFGVTDFFLAAWAQKEAAFLRRPDPEDPPRIFKP